MVQAGTVASSPASRSGLGRCNSHCLGRKVSGLRLFLVGCSPSIRATHRQGPELLMSARHPVPTAHHIHLTAEISQQVHGAQDSRQLEQVCPHARTHTRTHAHPGWPVQWLLSGHVKLNFNNMCVSEISLCLHMQEGRKGLVSAVDSSLNQSHGQEVSLRCTTPGTLARSG